MTSPTDKQVRDLAPTGQLVAAINLGNPVLAQGTADEPLGITVDLAREIAARLGVGLRFVCFDAARKSFAALTSGDATLAFLAEEPARAKDVAFTMPYVLIDGVYAVTGDSSYRSPADVDVTGVRVGAKEGSAYDLFLTRMLQHATIVRGADGTTVFEAQRLEVAAGIREPVSQYVAAHPELRLIDEPFMQIRQAIATAKTASAETTTWLSELLAELLANGFVADALRRSGQSALLAARRDRPAAAP